MIRAGTGAGDTCSPRIPRSISVSLIIDDAAPPERDALPPPLASETQLGRGTKGGAPRRATTPAGTGKAEETRGIKARAGEASAGKHEAQGTAAAAAAAAAGVVALITYITTCSFEGQEKKSFVD